MFICYVLGTVISMLPSYPGPTKIISIPDRGILQVRDMPGPEHGPTLILLHGLSVTGDLNWHKHYKLLTEHFRVIVYDHHGHGSGIRLKKKFTLVDAADDVLGVADALGVDKFTPVGYSMGGAVAQLVAYRHPERVRGMVLAATSTSFTNGRYGNGAFLLLRSFARLSMYSPRIVLSMFVHKVYGRTLPSNLDPWVLSQLLGHDWTTVAWAGASVGRYDSSTFLDKVTTRSAVIVTTKDSLVRAKDQEHLFALLRGDKKIFHIPGDHLSVYAAPTVFGPVLLEACRYACA